MRHTTAKNPTSFNVLQVRFLLRLWLVSHRQTDWLEPLYFSCRRIGEWGVVSKWLAADAALSSLDVLAACADVSSACPCWMLQDLVSFRGVCCNCRARGR
eukprot:5933010-Amphidinium_carterae.1